MRRSRKFLFLIACAVSLAGCERPVPPGGVPNIHYGSRAGEGSTGVHTVVEGDTVWQVAQRYRLSVRDILDINNLQPPYDLKENDRLRLPAPSEYTARAGDTWLSVARLFDTSAADLRAQNGAGSALRAGQVIRISRPVRLPAVLPPVPVAPVVAMPAVPPPAAPMARPASPAPVDKTAAAEPVFEPFRPPAVPARFVRPAEGPVVSRFGVKENGLHNDGINIKAPAGAPVRAAAGGTVVYAGNDLKALGNMVLVRHPGGYITTYAHLQKTLAAKGVSVAQGQVIGTVGSTGTVPGPQLHFEIRQGVDPVDPLSLI